MADTNGEKIWELEEKIKAIFGKDVFKRQGEGLRNETTLHTTKTNQMLKKLQEVKTRTKV